MIFLFLSSIIDIKKYKLDNFDNSYLILLFGTNSILYLKKRFRIFSIDKYYNNLNN